MQSSMPVLIPAWLAVIVTAALISQLFLGIAWAIRSDRSAAVRDERLNRLILILERHDPAALRSDVDRLKMDVGKLEAGHARNRERIETAYKDLAGTREPTRPG